MVAGSVPILHVGLGDDYSNLVGLCVGIFCPATVSVVLLFDHASGLYIDGCFASNLHHVSDR